MIYTDYRELLLRILANIKINDTFMDSYLRYSVNKILEPLYLVFNNRDLNNPDNVFIQSYPSKRFECNCLIADYGTSSA